MDFDLFSQWMEDRPSVHIIGGGGVGMSALARILFRMGFPVTASDMRDSKYLSLLADEGIQTWTGHKPENIRAEIVFYSSAVPKSDPERQYAEEKTGKAFSRHILLAWITSRFRTVAVAGTHGKTTTSAWIARALEISGRKIIALIGGTVPDWNSNSLIPADIKNGETILIIEADESDSSFLQIRADIAVVTNVDLDHTDQYSSLQEIEKDFRAFATAAVERGGSYVSSVENCGRLSNADTCCREISLNFDTQSLQYKGKNFSVSLRGRHNLHNASAVLCTLIELGLSPEEIEKSLPAFTGVRRRMEILEQIAGVTIMDDYGHHPEEIRAVLSTLRNQYRRIVAVFEPHRATRFMHFYKDFYKVLFDETLTDKVFMLPLFYSSDKPEDFPAVLNLFQSFSEKAAATLDFEQWTALGNSLQKSEEGTVVVFLGAGNSSEAARNFLEWFRRGR